VESSLPVYKRDNNMDGITSWWCMSLVGVLEACGMTPRSTSKGGAHGGRGSDAVDASITGDTVGDPFKDAGGTSLNILIKLMSIGSLITAGLVVGYRLPSFRLF
jgi:hypothetical protein